MMTGEDRKENADGKPGKRWGKNDQDMMIKNKGEGKQ